MFERNPVIGAGWQRSSSPTVIGDAEIASELRSRLPAAKQDFFSDVSPASVHNTYVGVLADLGLIGFALFAAAIVSIGLGAQRVLERVRGSELWPLARSSALGLVVILLWLNDNPIHGGQVDTIVLAILAGALTAVGKEVGSASPVPRRGRGRSDPTVNPRALSGVSSR